MGQERLNPNLNRFPAKEISIYIYIYIIAYIPEIAEESNNDTHIRCSKCRSKYTNDEEHINKYFGYTRLEEIYKTYIICRDRGKVHSKTYYDKHKDELNEYSHKYR